MTAAIATATTTQSFVARPRTVSAWLRCRSGAEIWRCRWRTLIAMPRFDEAVSRHVGSGIKRLPFERRRPQHLPVSLPRARSVERRPDSSSKAIHQPEELVVSYRRVGRVGASPRRLGPRQHNDGFRHSMRGGQQVQRAWESSPTRRPPGSWPPSSLRLIMNGWRMVKRRAKRAAIFQEAEYPVALVRSGSRS